VPEQLTQWVIDANGIQYDALDLAREIVSEWRALLTAEGLAVP
jgi:hypothetical protein